ncbi:MAG TPA: aldose epimerase family protein [Tepidisphaeraceae bacterium]|jgi:aldose 1-epimerase
MDSKDVPGVTRIDDFGALPDGTPVPRYALSNGRGLRAEVIGLGGIVLRLWTPDRNGNPGNVLLGPADVGQILNKSPYFGALIGRVGNRIGNAAFRLGDQSYTLAANDGPHSLHGGRVGYDKRLWTVEPQAGADGSAVLKLSLIDPAGTEGYPGTVRVEVVYTLTPANAWRIDYTATTDAPTPINLTQHAYFNLKDAGRSPVLDHVVTLFAQNYTPSDATLLPTGKIEPVRGTPLDYTQPRPIGQAFARLTNTPRGVDHNFVIDTEGTDLIGLRVAADVHELTTGRRMTVATTEPGIQFYTGNFLDNTLVGHDGFAYAQHTGFCLETQHYPNSVNVPAFPSTVLQPGTAYRSTTEYRFAAE